MIFDKFSWRMHYPETVTYSPKISGTNISENETTFSFYSLTQFEKPRTEPVKDPR